MKFMTALTSLVLATSAMAACPKQAKDAFSSYKKEMAVSSLTYKNFSVAINHYRHDGFQPEGKVFINRAATYIKGNRVSGYMIEVSDGGDEATISYIFNANKKLVVAYWSNQSPMTYWFCGSDNVKSEEETVGEPRI